MADKDPNLNTGQSDTQPQILVNEMGKTIDPAVVVDEADRTVLLTENETIVIEKEHLMDIPPKNRPRKVYGGMWGPVELATVGAAMLAVIVALLVYVFVVVPSNREVADNRLRLSNLENELASSREKYGSIENTQTQVSVLLSSVSDFESRNLPPAATGRTALYERINSLMASYGLINTTGPDLVPLDLADDAQGKQADDEKGKAKFRSLFPGVYVTTTLEGPYQNLRRFIKDIETGNEFVVVSAVELEPSDSEQKPDQAKPAHPGVPVGGGFPSNPTLGGFPAGNTTTPLGPSGQPVLPNSSRGKTHGSVVRLRLEMAAYFRRPNAEPASTAAVAQ